MDKYIEFVRVHLPDIIAFMLIVFTYISQFSSRLQNKKSNLLSRTFFKEKVDIVDNTFNELRLLSDKLIREVKEVKEENRLLKESLSKAENAIRAMCSGGGEEVDSEDKYVTNT